MANPVLVRDSFNLGKWYAYVPADKDGRYWGRYDFMVPAQNITSYAKYFVLHQILFGRVYEGQVVNPKRDVGGNWNESTGGLAWAGDLTAGAWTGRYTATAGSYADVTLPAAHNLIKVLAFQYTSGFGGDTMQISWNDAASWAAASKDGLAITEQSLAESTAGLVEYTVATKAVPGTRKLRIWMKGVSANKTVRIYAVRSWNTLSAGDPSTATGGIATGHDMIDTIANCGTASKPDIREADQGCVVLSGNGAAHEFAIANGPVDHATWFTGGYAHMWTATGNYPYTYAGGTFTDGPTILLGTDMTDMGGMGTDGATVNLLGTVHTDEQIFIRSVGYPTWGESTPPKVVWTYAIDRTALSFNVAMITAGSGVDFDATGTIDGKASQVGQYSTMFCLNPNLSGFWKTPAENTRYVFPLTEAASADQSIYGVGSYEVFVNGWPVKVKCSTTGEPKRVFFWGFSGSTKKWKLYCEMSPQNWGVTKAGTPYKMADGGAMSFGGRYEVSRLDPEENSIFDSPSNSLFTFS